MEIHLFDNGSQVPQPRHKIQIEELKVTPYPDRFRVFIEIKVTNFLERPNLLLVAHDEDDQVVSELSIIETMHTSMEFTLHIRNKTNPAGTYSLTAELFYETRNPPQDKRIEGFTIPESDLQDEQ